MKKTNLFEKFNKVFYALLIMTAVSFTFTACDNGDDDPDSDPDPDPVAENSILDIVSESETHTQLEAFVKADADLLATLGGEDLTLFAPNDAAFDALKDRLQVESLSQVDPAIISEVLEFHVANSVVRRDDITVDTEIETEQGESISMNPSTGNIFDGGTVTDVKYVGNEILATNGVVHVIGTILIPPSIFDFIKSNLGFTSQTIFLGADFTVLASAILKADEYATANDETTLTSILASPTSNITVFAPVNAVFAQAGITLDTFTGEQWYGLISNHVVTSGKVLSEDISLGQSFTSAAGGPITVISLDAPTTETITTGIALSSDGIPTTAEAQVAVADIESNNGVVHAIAGVLTPPTLVMAAVNLNANFSTLKAAIAKADTYATAEGIATLTSVLSDGDATLTVFAPVNDVFTSANITLESFTSEEWYGLIANHVIASESLGSTDLTSGDVYTSAAGSPITVLPSGGLDSDGQPGAEATIAAPDAFVGSNGIVHGIAGILVLPNAGTDQYAGTYTSDAVVCGGDGEGNCNPETVGIEITATVTFTATSTAGVYQVSDITFGLYPQGYGDDPVVGNLVINADGAVTITDQLDQYDDPFNGSGQVNEDGTIDIEVSNTWGDNIVTTLTPAGARISFKAINKNIPKLSKNK